MNRREFMDKMVKHQEKILERTKNLVTNDDEQDALAAAKLKVIAMMKQADTLRIAYLNQNKNTIFYEWQDLCNQASRIIGGSQLDMQLAKQ